MSIEFSVIDSLTGLRIIEDEWRALAGSGGGGALFRGPTWVIPWWHAYHQTLAARLYVFAGRVEGELVCLAPLYRREARAAGLKITEVRMLGDAGPRPPALDLLVAPGFEDRAGAALARMLDAAADEWDLIDLEPLADPSRVRAHLISRLHAAGHHVESIEAAGGARRIALRAPGIDLGAEPGEDALCSAYVGDRDAIRKGMGALRRLSRLEWAAREETSPLADPESSQLLEEVALELGERGQARLARLDDSHREAIAAALVVDDADRAVVLAMAVDPEHIDRGAPARILAAEARAAVERGRVALDVVIGATDYQMPPLPCSRQRALTLKVYSKSASGALARTFETLRRQVDLAREAPQSAAAGARAAWAKIRTTAANVATYRRLHLYRGELWTRGIEPVPGLTLELFSEKAFDVLSDYDRAELVEALELDEQYCRHKWHRGDLVVFARLNQRAAGITWCARASVEVPELGRDLHLGPAEAYIHDVFVAAQARGRAVAPSMLEFLAHELRQRDVYRAWALIGSENIASSRAFEKAAYTAVADIVYARMANVDRLVVRPPDPEAKKLLGIS